MINKNQKKTKNTKKKQNGYKNKRKSKKVVRGGDFQDVTEGVKKYDSEHYLHNGTYTGSFMENEDGEIQRSGYGEMIYVIKGEYKGYWLEDRREGQGIMKYGNGDKYDGGWDHNIHFGQGTMKYNNGDEYIGDWDNNTRFDSGTMTYKNGDKYEGKWSGGLKKGQGIMKYNNGDEYNGNWNQDKRDGQGTMKYGNGNPSYTGLWYHNRRSTEEEIENEMQRQYDNDDPDSDDESRYHSFVARLAPPRTLIYDSDDSDISTLRYDSDDSDDSDELTLTPIDKIKTTFSKNVSYRSKAHDPSNPYGPDPLIELMDNNKDLIAFKFKDNFVTIEKETLKKMVDLSDSENSLFYECIEVNTMKPENIIKEKPLLNLRSIGLLSGGFIRYEYILDVINGINRYFLIYDPDKQLLKSVVSDKVMRHRGSHVSASHCQEGQEGRLYEMEYINDLNHNASIIQKTYNTYKNKKDKATKIQKTYRRYKNKKGGNKRKKSVKKNMFKV
jgi:hypothetical protein